MPSNDVSHKLMLCKVATVFCLLHHMISVIFEKYMVRLVLVDSLWILETIGQIEFLPL